VADLEQIEHLVSKEQLALVKDALQRTGASYAYGPEELGPAVAIRRRDGTHTIETGTRRFEGAIERELIYDAQAFDSLPDLEAAFSELAPEALELIASSSDDERRRAMAIMILIENEDPIVSSLIVKQLGDSEIPNSWRRTIILLSEDVQFTGVERTSAATLLRKFAETNRDSNDPEDVPPVLSALRSYASIASLQSLPTLVDYLNSDHRVNTMLTAIKCVIHVLEVNPPTHIDSMPEVASKVTEVAKVFLHPLVLPQGSNAAIAVNATVASAALAASGSAQLIEDVRLLNKPWIADVLRDRLLRLYQSWSMASSRAPGPVLTLVSRAIEHLR
jgi:hypothetical protein